MNIAVPAIEKKAGQTILIFKNSMEWAGRSLKEKGDRLQSLSQGLGTREDFGFALELLLKLCSCVRHPLQISTQLEK